MAKKNEALWYSCWATAWGPMGAAACEGGLCRVILPHYQLNDIEQLLAWEHPTATRDDARFEILAGLTRDYFNGKCADFGQIACLMPRETTLGGKVLAACRKIPYGKTMTYGALATLIGAPDSARAVAAALGKNEIPLVIPCHRVTYSGGGPGGFSAPGGVDLKLRMLSLERRGQ